MVKIRCISHDVWENNYGFSAEMESREAAMSAATEVRQAAKRKYGESWWDLIDSDYDVQLDELDREHYFVIVKYYGEERTPLLVEFEKI